MAKYGKIIRKILDGFSDANKTRTKMIFKYEIIIHWSEDDDAFIAEIPELMG